MSEATFVRLLDEDSKFIEALSKQKKTTKSAIIKELVHKSIKEERLESALKRYAEGEITIREGAGLSGLSYRQFLNELGKKGLLGLSAKDQEEMIKETLEYLG